MHHCANATCARSTPSARGPTAIALCVLAACRFEIAYRPKDYNQDSAATTSASVPVSSVG